MISKEIFCKALALIREQDEINRKFEKALDLVGNGHYVFGTENKYLEGLLMVLKETMKDHYDYIDWWLYEESSDYLVESADGQRTWCLKEPEALYDFLVEVSEE